MLDALWGKEAETDWLCDHAVALLMLGCLGTVRLFCLQGDYFAERNIQGIAYSSKQVETHAHLGVLHFPKMGIAGSNHVGKLL